MPQTQHFTITDPRTFDGDPFEVARRACAQAEALAAILATCIERAEIMARNAQMSRNLMEDENDAGGPRWEHEAQHVRFNRAHQSAVQVEKDMKALGVAAGFNPKARLPKG